MLDQSVTFPSLGPVATCGGMMASDRAVVPLSAFVEGITPEPETKRQRAERNGAMRDIRSLFHTERRARRHLAIRTSVDRAIRTPRTSHRVGSPKPATSSSSDDDGEPPRQLERVLVATVDPSGRPREVLVEIDPLHIDPTALVFAARRAAGHSLASAVRGLNGARWRALHPGKVGAA